MIGELCLMLTLVIGYAHTASEMNRDPIRLY